MPACTARPPATTAGDLSALPQPCAHIGCGCQHWSLTQAQPLPVKLAPHRIIVNMHALGGSWRNGPDLTHKRLAGAPSHRHSSKAAHIPRTMDRAHLSQRPTAVAPVDTCSAGGAGLCHDGAARPASSLAILGALWTSTTSTTLTPTPASAALRTPAPTPAPLRPTSASAIACNGRWAPVATPAGHWRRWRGPGATVLAAAAASATVPRWPARLSWGSAAIARWSAVVAPLTAPAGVTET